MAGNTKQDGNTTSGADGITKREAPVTWRPSPEARLALARLLDRENCSRGDLLNRLVLAADAGEQSSPLMEDAPAIVATARGGIDRKPSSAWAPRRRPDPTKIEAFQRKAGMGGVKSRG